MSPTARWLLRLYPPVWRARSGEDLLALLEDILKTARVIHRPGAPTCASATWLAADLDQKLARYNQQVPTYRLDRGRLPPHLAAQRFDATT